MAGTFPDVARLIGEVCALRAADVREEALLSEYGIDSVRAMDLIIALEDRFAIRIEDEETAALRTVGDIVRYVERKRA